MRLGRLSIGQRYLYSAQLVSALGTSVTAIALPTLAVVSLHAAALEVSLLVTAGNLPGAVIAPLFGALVDRSSRVRSVMIMADLARAIALGIIPVLVYFHLENMLILYLVAGIVGTFNGLYTISSQSMVPKLVSKDGLAAGNALVSVTTSTGQLSGPALGGVLVEYVGAARAIIADVISYVVSAVLLRRIPEPSRDVSVTNRVSIKGQIRAGWRIVKTNLLLRRLLGGAGTLNLAGSAIGGLYVLFAYRFLRVSSSELGYSFTLGSASAIAGGLVAPRLIRRWGLRGTITCAALVAGLSMFLLPFAHYPYGLLFLCLYQAVFTFPAVVWSIGIVTVRQAAAGSSALGRVNSFSQMVMVGVMPVGAAMGGVVADIIGVRAALYSFSAISATAVFFYISSSMWRNDVRGAREPSEILLTAGE